MGPKGIFLNRRLKKYRMQMEKQKWVDDVLNSTDGMSRAIPADVMEKVLSQSGKGRQAAITRPVDDNALIWRIAASVIFLLVLNSVTIISYRGDVLRSREEQKARAAVSLFGPEQDKGSDPGAAIFGN